MGKDLPEMGGGGGGAVTNTVGARYIELVGYQMDPWFFSSCLGIDNYELGRISKKVCILKLKLGQSRKMDNLACCPPPVAIW